MLPTLLVVSCASGATTANPDWERTNIEIGANPLLVAVADTSSERSEGLMKVEDLGDLDGMIFVYDRPQFVNFTMRNTILPLDIWFIDTDGVIVGTAEMEPCVSESCLRYGSPTEVMWVLETPLSQFDFAIGDVVSNMPSG